MAEFTPEIVDQIVAACTTGAGEAGEALGRALDGEITVSVGSPATVDPDALPDEFSGAGLVVVLNVGTAAAVFLLPESTGMIPAWCAAPDPTGESKLTTLAQELGMILLPEEFMPEDFKAAQAKNLAGALRRGGIAEGAGLVPLELASEGKQGTASLIWPIPNPASVVGTAAPKPAAAAPKAAPKAASKPAPKPNPPATPKTPAPPKRRSHHLSELPKYSRSLLRIKVPVVVTLAEKRQMLGRIVELGPGSIIQFEKSCEDMLDLDVADCHVATGEAVKVGDKFGLRITSIVLPEERFHTVTPES